jgi:YfiH family protein
LVARQAGWALRLQTADCLPLLLLDTCSGHYGAVHAGWRGTLAGVLGNTLEAMHGAGGSTWLAIGPGIRSCCFEIGPEVVAAFHARWGENTRRWLHAGAGGRRHLDLAAANLFQALEAGVPAKQVLDTGLCTRCRRDLFFSYRGDGGATGRIITLAGRP